MHLRLDLKSGRNSPLLQCFCLEDLKRPWSYSFLGHQTSNPGIMPSRLVGDFCENISQQTFQVSQQTFATFQNKHLRFFKCQNRLFKSYNRHFKSHNKHLRFFNRHFKAHNKHLRLFKSHLQFFKPHNRHFKSHNRHLTFATFHNRHFKSRNRHLRLFKSQNRHFKVAIRYFTVSLRIRNRYQRYLVWARYWSRWVHQHRPEFAECSLFTSALVKCRRCEIWACEISPIHPPTHQFHNCEISE